MKTLLFVIVVATGFAACTLFDDDPPQNTCMTTQDCFRAQGEVCNVSTHVCEPGAADAGVDAP